MFLGIDIGTSAVKAVVINEGGILVAESSVPLQVSRPQPLMSEQEPEAWWTAVNQAVLDLSEYSQAVQAIGLSGQMHGAVLLDDSHRPLRPAILWNDGRSGKECEELESTVDVPAATGNHAMPGFTAPKLVWVKKHEPEVFDAVRMILLPKDYVRWRMTGEFATEMSDAAGTLWLDVARRQWHHEMLEATDLVEQQLPPLFEGSDIVGKLSSSVADAWSMQRVPVVAGGGDQAAGAVGAGAVQPGMCTLSLGTSGVIFAPASEYRAKPEAAIHTFCHALPDSWHQMAVILSAAGSLSWITQILRASSEASLIELIERRAENSTRVMFLPYLAGERTPYNNPLATGVFTGLTGETDQATLAYAVLEGVALALKNCYDALTAAGANTETLNVIGGGSQSKFWGQLIADCLGRELIYRHDAAVGPALGAARLAQIGVKAGTIKEVCKVAPEAFRIEPNMARAEEIGFRYTEFLALYQDLNEHFSRVAQRA